MRPRRSRHAAGHPASAPRPSPPARSTAAPYAPTRRTRLRPRRPSNSHSSRHRLKRELAFQRRLDRVPIVRAPDRPIAPGEGEHAAPFDLFGAEASAVDLQLAEKETVSAEREIRPAGRAAPAVTDGEMPPPEQPGKLDDLGLKCLLALPAHSG